jgi:putative transposase
MEAVRQLIPTVGIASACDALGVARASFYRQPVFGPALPATVILRPSPARALGAEERETVRAVLNSTRFQDCAPAAV